MNAVCRLTVRPGENESVAAALPEGDSREEAPGQRWARVLEWHLGHADPHVVGHERHDLRYITCFERFDQPRQEFLFGGRVDSGEWLTVGISRASVARARFGALATGLRAPTQYPTRNVRDMGWTPWTPLASCS